MRAALSANSCSAVASASFCFLSRVRAAKNATGNAPSNDNPSKPLRAPLEVLTTASKGFSSTAAATSCGRLVVPTDDVVASSAAAAARTLASKPATTLVVVVVVEEEVVVATVATV